MSVSAWRVYEYSVECDVCGNYEVYHTDDSDRGVLVHSIPTAIRASGFHRYRGILLCPMCYEDKKNKYAYYRYKRENVR